MSETNDKKYNNLTKAIEQLLNAAAECEIPIVEIQFSDIKNDNANDTLSAVRENQLKGYIVTKKTDDGAVQHVVACLQTGYP